MSSWIHFMSLESLDAVTWSHAITFPQFLLQKEWKEDGEESFKKEDGEQFLLEKNIALSMRKARLMCCERVPGQLPKLPNLKSNSIYFLAFQRAVSNGDKLVAQASASTLWLCSLSSAFKNMRWLLQEMHTHPFWCHSSLRSDFYFKENLQNSRITYHNKDKLTGPSNIYTSP